MARPPKVFCARFPNSMMALRRHSSVTRSSRQLIRKEPLPTPSPSNANYEKAEAPEEAGKNYKLEVAGLVENKNPWPLDELYALPEVSQITRHICVEGWSAIGSWQGTQLSEFLKRVGA